MITLLSFPGSLGEPSLSPFCSKAMILLEMSGMEWETRFVMNPSKAPFGKLPVLLTPEGPIADSNLMLSWLEEQGVDLFAGLTGTQHAQAHAMIRMIEENLRYGLMYERWVAPEGWALFKPLVFADMPAPVRAIIPGLIRKPIMRGIAWQGLGRMDAKARQAYFAADLAALDALMQEEDWLAGGAPGVIDASALPVLSSIERLQHDCLLRRTVQENETLMRYIERGRARFYEPITERNARV